MRKWVWGMIVAFALTGCYDDVHTVRYVIEGSGTYDIIYTDRDGRSIETTVDLPWETEYAIRTESHQLYIEVDSCSSGVTPKIIYDGVTRDIISCSVRCQTFGACITAELVNGDAKVAINF